MHGGMANASVSATLRMPATAAAASTAPACPSTLSKPNNISTTIGRPWHGRRRRSRLSCRATGGGRGDVDDDSRLLWLPRRDVLAGLTGVAAGLTAYPGLGLADLAKVYECRKGDSKVSAELLGCVTRGGLPCPQPKGKDIEVVDFVPPKSGDLRVRRPAHKLSDKEVASYRKALARMRAAPDSDPSSFKQQAAIHEAYCDGHYRFDPTEKNRPFDVHFSWIFAPWHRMYIYFYERMVNHYMDEGETFALPYWSWDAAAGMALPAMFRDPTVAGGGGGENPLHNPNRNPANVNALVDLDYLSRGAYRKLNKGDRVSLASVPLDMPDSELYKDTIDRNLRTMYHQMIRTGKGTQCFLGDKFCTEASFGTNEINTRSRRRQGPNGTKIEKKGSSGSLERMAHTSVHVWLGDPAVKVDGHDGQKHGGADMGFLGTAANDPAFYSHHSNVDRMWHLWNTELGGRNYDDPEWLDTSFVFYDFAGDDKKDGTMRPGADPQEVRHCMRLVRIRVRDVLDTANLGYTYEEPEKLEWMASRPASRLVPAGGSTSTAAAPVFPVELKVGDSVVVPAVTRPEKPADGAVEVLVIEDIELDPSNNAKFDVAINVPKEEAVKVGPQYKEYAGSFASVQSTKEKPGDTVVTKLAVPIDEVLADIGVKAGEAVSVVVVPRTEGLTLNKAPRIEAQKYC
ncbi:hypothetical protein ACP70R_003469 [Stipagrostis hirtigluma subsp. patula]